MLRKGCGEVWYYLGLKFLGGWLVILGKLKIREKLKVMRIVLEDEVKCIICNYEIEESNYLFVLCFMVR